MNMQMKMLLSTLALVLAAGGFTASHAQEQGTDGAAAQSQQPPESPSQTPPVGAQESTPGGTGTSAGANEIMNMKAGEIAGRQVYNAKGRELGKVDAVARDRTSGNLMAVISVGGFLGFGGSKVALPIEQLKLQDDKLIATTALSKKDLRNQASKYEEKKYEVVAEDTTLSQVAPTAGASAAGGTPPLTSQQPQAPSSEAGAVSFQSLDRNHDGYLSSEEVSNNPSILSQWQELDTNGDNRLDQSEFSAFEAQSQAPSSGAGAVSFDSLDRNKDGYLTSDEVGNDPSIVSRWNELDKNGDNKLDQAEFSAFEQSEEMRPSGDTMRGRPEAGSQPSGQSPTGDMPPEQSAPSPTQ